MGLTQFHLILYLKKIYFLVLVQKILEKNALNIVDKVTKPLKKIDENKGRIYPDGCGSHPHQIYNEILSEHGFIGFLVLIFIFLKLFLRNFSLNNNLI